MGEWGERIAREEFNYHKSIIVDTIIDSSSKYKNRL